MEERYCWRDDNRIHVADTFLLRACRMISNSYAVLYVYSLAMALINASYVAFVTPSAGEVWSSRPQSLQVRRSSSSSPCFRRPCASTPSLLMTLISVTMATMTTEACQLNVLTSCGTIGVTSAPYHDTHHVPRRFRGSSAARSSERAILTGGALLPSHYERRT
ncbi:hypothetical protein BJY52DRAFT_503061 [Lactarius psammicola]|nr:hypothetical protein BJY52DRAFT_503061 [Lactarius psammicola]